MTKPLRTDKYGKFAIYAQTETDEEMMMRYTAYGAVVNEERNLINALYKENEDEDYIRMYELAQVNTLKQAERVLKKIEIRKRRIKELQKSLKEVEKIKDRLEKRVREYRRKLRRQDSTEEE